MDHAEFSERARRRRVAAGGAPHRPGADLCRLRGQGANAPAAEARRRPAAAAHRESAECDVWRAAGRPETVDRAPDPRRRLPGAREGGALELRPAQRGRRRRPVPARATRELRTWSAAELRRFLDSIRDQRLYALCHLLAQPGARRGDALGARWEDFDGARWTVCRNLVPAKGGAIESTPKTATGRRSVALDPTTGRGAARVAKAPARGAARLGPGVAGHGSQVHARGTAPTWRPAASLTFTALVAGCEGLPPIRLHDLRHTHATLALQAGVHVKVVAERLGHSSVKVTLDTYSHAIPAMQADAAAGSRR